MTSYLRYVLLALLLTLGIGLATAAGKKEAPFFKAEFSEKQAYTGQPVVYTLKLYTTERDLAYVRPLANMRFSDAMAQVLVHPSQAYLLPDEKVKGTLYHVVLAAQYLVTPRSDGRVDVPSIPYSVGVNVPTQYRDPFWGMFSRNNVEQIRLDTPTASIKVKALPTPPADFCGAVGSFDLVTYFPYDDFAKDEPAEMTLRLSGFGTLSDVRLPDLHGIFGPDATLGSVEESGRKSYVKDGRLYSEIEFTAIFTPRTSGDITLPEISLTYFDTSKGAYRKAVAPKHVIKVGGASKGKSHSEEYFV